MVGGMVHKWTMQNSYQHQQTFIINNFYFLIQHQKRSTCKMSQNHQQNCRFKTNDNILFKIKINLNLGFSTKKLYSTSWSLYVECHFFEHGQNQHFNSDTKPTKWCSFQLQQPKYRSAIWELATVCGSEGLRIKNYSEKMADTDENLSWKPVSSVILQITKKQNLLRAVWPSTKPFLIGSKMPWKLYGTYFPISIKVTHSLPCYLRLCITCN